MKKICTVEGCEKKHFGNGLCNMHYKRMRKHGDVSITKHVLGEDRSKHKLYRTYQGMKERCHYRNNDHFYRYGGRGITICDRRLGQYGFSNWLEDMGPKPEGTSIDRINNDGNYEPSNCRRATVYEQHANTKNNNKTVGVSLIKKINKREASLIKDGKTVLHKRFKTEQEAIDARKEAERKYLIT